MKSVLYSLSLLLCAYGSSMAQCTPDTTLVGNNFYFAPASSQYVNVGGTNFTILPYAETGVAYSEILQFKVPLDTSVNGLTANIDYLKVLNISNLPAGFQLNCNPANCTFPGGSFGCGELAGTGGPADSVVLKVAIELKFSSNGQSLVTTDTIRDIIFVTKGFVSQEEQSDIKLDLYPIPADRELTLSFESMDQTSELSIRDLSGKEIFKASREANSNKIWKLDVSSIPNGIYIYTLKNGLRTNSGRFSVEH